MKDKVLVVGGSSDIGLDVTERLLNEGYDVIATFRTRDDVLNRIQNKHKQYAGKLDIRQLDVKCIDQIRDLFFDKNLSKGLRGLVFLPSVERNISLLDLTPEILIDDYHVNFFSAVFLYQSFAKHIISSGLSGSIVGLSSEITRFGGNHQFPYVASKGSLNMLTMVSAKEWGPYNLRVNAVSPGKIAAGINLKRDQNEIYPTPLGRMGSVTEVSNVVAWLLSEQASYITGAVIPANGGR